MKTPALIQFLFLAFFFTSFPNAQGAPGEVDLSFDPGSGINGAVNAAVVQPDGKIIIGGEFTTINGLARRLVGRLNPDGSGDPAFEAVGPVDEGGNSRWGAVFALALQPDGKVLVGHYSGIDRLNSDGSLDTSFVADVGASWEDGSVLALAVQPNGKVLIGGSFVEVNGTSRNGLARLNANGSLDRSFFPGSVLGNAHSLALQADGKVLVLGFFTVEGINRTAVARLKGDGSLDATFLIAEEIGDASLMELLPDGKVLVAGYFTSGGYGIARLSADGSLDPGFIPRLPPYEGHPPVVAMVVQSDGKVLISGDFATVDGRVRHQIARLRADGSLDESFQPETSPGGEVRTVVLQPDGKLLIAGAITTGSEPRRKPLARLHADGGLDGGFQAGAAVDGRVTSLVVQPDGRLLMGGTFTTVGGLTRPGIARLRADGSLDRTFDPAIRFHDTASQIRSVVSQLDGKVLITGIFTTSNGEVRQHKTIARLLADGSMDHGFQPDLTPFLPTDSCPPGFWYCERSVTAETALVQPDGRIIVSGSSLMIAYGDEALVYFGTSFVARFHDDGSLDSGFQVGLEKTEALIQRMLLQPDGKLLVAGRFRVNGTNRGMVRLHSDGSLDHGFNPAPLIAPASMGLQSDGRIVIGVDSWMLQGSGRYALARLHADGSLDATFNPPTGEHDYVQALALQPDGKVLVAGRLYSIDGSSAPTVARLNSDGSLDVGFHRAVASGHIMALAYRSNGNVLIGGDFSTVDGVARPHVAGLLGDSPMPPLNIARVNGSVVLSWPAAAWNVRLHETTDLSLPTSWSPVGQEAVTTGGLISVQVPTTTPRNFFRLSLGPNSP